MLRRRLLPLVCALLLLLGLPAAADHDTGPNLGSVHAAVANLDTGELLYAERAGDIVPIASVTKLMTAIVVLDSGEPLDEWLRIQDWSEPPPVNAFSRIRLESELTRGELLKITLMSSENRAAYNLARHHPGGHEAFIEAMNARAADLGMDDTRFVDPSGLSSDNVSTAVDLIRLLDAARAYDEIIAASNTTGHHARFRRPQYVKGYRNTNALVHRGRWNIGVSKSGYLDAAGRCLVMTTRVDGSSIAMVMLNSFGTRTPIGDAGRIRTWVRTGRPGSVSGRALDYKQERAAALDEEREVQPAADTL